MCKKNCLNCAFFSKLSISGEQRFPNVVSRRERENIKNTNDVNSVFDLFPSETPTSLSCYKDVWDEGIDTTLQERRKETIIEMIRDNFCFYYPYQSGMGVKAAEKLECRESMQKGASVDRKHVIVGLWIAALGLLFNVDIVKKLVSWIWTIFSFTF